MKKRLTILGTLFAIIFIIYYLISKPSDPIAVFKISGISATATSFSYLFWNYFLWRISFFKNLHRTPIVRGIWYSRDIPLNESGQQLYVELKVKQYFDSINVSVKSQYFTTTSLISKMIQDSRGGYLYFVYVTKPRKKYFNVHQVHYGTMILHCQSLVLNGEFFTSEGIKSKIEFYPKGYTYGQETPVTSNTINYIDSKNTPLDSFEDLFDDDDDDDN